MAGKRVVEIDQKRARRQVELGCISRNKFHPCGESADLQIAFRDRQAGGIDIDADDAAEPFSGGDEERLPLAAAKIDERGLRRLNADSIDGSGNRRCRGGLIPMHHAA